MPEPQANDGYGCKCSFVAADLNTFRAHLTSAGAQDGKGVHASIGRINMQTGEVTLPPWNQRTKEQKLASRYGKKKQKDSDEGKKAPDMSRPTAVLADATQLKFVPRVFSCDYSPIMMAGQAASQKLWAWPPMPLIDFLDTVIFKYFKRCGVTLTGFTIDETEEERIEREKVVAISLAEQAAVAEAAERERQQPKEETHVSS